MRRAVAIRLAMTVVMGLTLPTDTSFRAVAGESTPAGIEVLSSSQFDRALDAVRDTNRLTIEVFWSPHYSAPVLRLPYSIEDSPQWHCTIDDHILVERLVDTVLTLRLAEGDGGGVYPALKLKFRRNGRLVFEAEFMEISRANTHGDMVTPALINGRLGMVHNEPVAKLIEFFEQESGIGL